MQYVVFVTGFFHLACVQDSSMLWPLSVFHYFFIAKHSIVQLGHILLISSSGDGKLKNFLIITLFVLILKSTPSLLLVVKCSYSKQYGTQICKSMSGLCI